MLGLVAYLLLAPPILVLAPLVGLLLISRPASAREWWWVLSAGSWVAFAVWQAGGIAAQVVQAWGIILTGAFLVVMLSRPTAFVPAALRAMVIAVAIMLIWAGRLGVGWRELQLAVTREGWEFCRSLVSRSGAGDAMVPAGSGLEDYVDALAEGVGTMAVLFPGLLALSGLLGLGLAWNWYHRISSRPLGEIAGPFGQFRFNDQLVWGAVLGIALVVFPTPAPWPNVGANLVLLFGGLYAVRGAAVIRATSGRLSAGMLIGIGLGIVFLLPLALGGLMSLGLADTWIDFRRRAAPSLSGE